jgi:glycosyltransferase involved in cell wall biosynthesis
MSHPKITVVTPSFNQAPFLEATLLSIRAQQYPNLEHIVIDGGSTDGSVDILRRYASDFTYWVSEPDGGHVQGLIKGFSRATGDILCWLNSDDLFCPGALHSVAAFFASNREARAAYGDSEWIDINGNPIKPKKEHSFNRFVWTYCYNFIPQPSTFWRRDLYEQVGGLDVHFQLAFDADLWIRFADVTRLWHIPRQLSCMRFYPEQRNQRLRGISDREDEEMRRRYTGPESPFMRGPKRMVARTLRVGWKAARGCYW